MININDIKSYLEEKKVKHIYVGNPELNFDSFCPLNSLKDNSMTWIRDSANYDLTKLVGYKKLLIVCNSRDVSDTSNINFLFVDNPHSVFFSLIADFFYYPENNFESISNNSIIQTQNIGQNVKIGHFCYIGKEVIIEDNVIINNNVSIDGKVFIGENTIIYSGAVIGMNGFGFYDNIENNHMRVPHLGGVIIGKNVEIGANTCIAKGCLGDTIINDNVKIDNLCHIAHNVIIGKRSKIIAQTMLAGSSVIGEDVWVAPCSSVKNQVVIGNNCFIGMGSVVIKDIEPDTSVSGFPARQIKTNN